MLKVILLSYYLLLSINLNADTISMYTENYPPYSMEINHKAKGFSVDLLDMLLNDIKSKQSKKDIKFVPWVRGYNIVLKNKNSMIFSTVKNKYRENLFKWVGPICSIKDELITQKNKHIKIRNINDLKKYKVGVISGWSTIDTLIDKGFKSKDIVLYYGKDAQKKAFEHMALNNLDIFAFSLISIPYDQSLNKFKQDSYESIYTIKTTDVYFAFNKNTDDKIIKQLQSALNTTKSDDRYNQLYNHYLKKGKK